MGDAGGINRHIRIDHFRIADFTMGKLDRRAPSAVGLLSYVEHLRPIKDNMGQSFIIDSHTIEGAVSFIQRYIDRFTPAAIRRPAAIVQQAAKFGPGQVNIAQPIGLNLGVTDGFVANREALRLDPGHAVIGKAILDGKGIALTSPDHVIVACRINGQIGILNRLEAVR